MKNIYIIFAVFSFCQFAISQENYYGIYFLTFPNVITDTRFGEDWFLNDITENWGATGVQLDVHLRDIHPRTPSSLEVLANPETPSYNWLPLDKALDRILAFPHPILGTPGLDVHIRVRLGSLLPAWVDFYREGPCPACGLVHAGHLFADHDFHCDKSGHHNFKEPPSKNSNRHLNFTSPNAITYYKNILRAVAEHTMRYLLDHQFDFANRRPVEFVPSTTYKNAELEYNSDRKMAGYSKYDVISFYNYLAEIYPEPNGLDSLIACWGPANGAPRIQFIEDVDPSRYDWDVDSNTFHQYQYPGGRLDFLNFRFKKLKGVIDLFSEAIKEVEANYPVDKYLSLAIQIGSIYDYHLEYRGFLDATALLENVDALRLADIPGYSDYFKFSADYARSITNYWESMSGRNYGFSSETNNPVKKEHRTISKKWCDQIDAFFYKGADCHIVANWGNLDNKAAEEVHLKKNYTSWDRYRIFAEKLKSLSGKFRQPHGRLNRAVHLSANYAPFRNVKENFYMPISVFMNADSKSEVRTYLKNNLFSYDIITDYMIAHSPNFLLPYRYISFSKGSEYMSDVVYQNLIKKKLYQSYVPFQTDERYFKTAGVKTERGKDRSIIQ